MLETGSDHRSESEAHVPEAMGALFDPYQPLTPGAERSRPGQRARRARILAATRRLLGERGCEAITVRDIARASDLALQTVYNLVGPRNLTITAAMSEYSLHVGRMAARTEPVPSLPHLIDTWIDAAEACPEFARQSNLIFFTPSRDIYYQFRDIQIRGVATLLRRQRNAGHVAFQTPPRQLAEQLVFHSTALWIDWADRPFPLVMLRQKLLLGLPKLLRD